MTTIRYQSPERAKWEEESKRPDKATVWALILVVVATAIALTFGEAQGSAAALTALLSG